MPQAPQRNLWLSLRGGTLLRRERRDKLRLASSSAIHSQHKARKEFHYGLIGFGIQGMNPVPSLNLPRFGLHNGGEGHEARSFRRAPQRGTIGMHIAGLKQPCASQLRGARLAHRPGGGLAYAFFARLFLGLFCISLAFVVSMAPAQAARLLDARIEGDGSRLVLRFDSAAPASRYFALTGPTRLVVDLPGTEVSPVTFIGRGLIARVRIAQFEPDRGRLVLDLSQPARLGTASKTEDNLLILPLTASADGEFAKLVTRGTTLLPTAMTSKAVASNVASAPVAASANIVKVSADTPAKASTPRLGNYRPVVVIDAGHGGKDVGAISALEGRYEKDATLAIARAVRDALEATGRYKVVMTRDSDIFLPLGRRVAIARQAKAQLFISIHADSAQGSEARGATVYTLSEVASDKEAARLAAKENRSDLIGGVTFASAATDVSDILIDLLQRETMNVSAEFANTLQREMRDGIYFRSNYHRFAGFAVLKAPDVPSVLLETGYLSSIEDSRMLFSSSGQKKIARGVAEAVDAHFMQRMALR